MYEEFLSILQQEKKNVLRTPIADERDLHLLRCSNRAPVGL